MATHRDAAGLACGARGDKIRTYNFPQDRCTDHRAKVSFPLTRVFTGDIDELVEACRRWEKEEKLKALSQAA